ncbi:MAG: hemerythrin domain-containing protein, partial [Proteobacteria bacterium]|nr:hemerythrin domain-containing protein [Pseudomonadota bacterium]
HPDAAHHPIEDRIFRQIYTHDAAIATSLGDLEIEHAHLRELLGKIERTMRDVLSDLEMPRSELIDAVTGFVEFLRSHMLMEAGRFFPAAQRVLTQKDWDEIEQEMKGLNAAAGSKYDDMKDQILQAGRELV